MTRAPCSFMGSRFEFNFDAVKKKTPCDIFG